VGGHRLFTERDIIRLRWVKQRIDAGMQTSQAIHALQHQEQTGQPVLTEEAFSAQPSRRSGQLYSSETLEQGDKRNYFAGLQDRLVQALTQRETQIADDILSEALALVSPEVLIQRLIQPVMEEIGNEWEKNKISVATEHLATNYLRQRLLHWMVSAPPPRSQQAIVRVAY
jgi:DNA-binding transcriptional MerR regulator